MYMYVYVLCIHIYVLHCMTMHSHLSVYKRFISGGEKAHECHIPGSGGVLNFKGLIEEYVTIENQIKYNSHTLVSWL